VQREIEALGPAARRQVFTTLVQRALSASPPQRRAQQRALRQRWAVLPPTPAMQWRALGLALLLGAPPRPSARAGQAAALSQLASPAHAATALLAQALGAAPEARQAWRNAAAQALAESGAAAPRGPAAGLAPATSLRELQHALRVRHLAPMQRPLLLRAWILAAERSGLASHMGTGDALHLACLLLDVPVPDSLLR